MSLCLCGTMQDHFFVINIDLNPLITFIILWIAGFCQLILSIFHKEILILSLRVNQLVLEYNENKNKKNDSLLDRVICLHHLN